MTIARNKRAKEIEERRFNRMIDIIASRHLTPIRRDIKRSIKRAINHYEKVGQLPDYEEQLIHTNDIKKSLDKLYRQTANISAKRQFNNFRSIFKSIDESYIDNLIIKEISQSDAQTIFDELATKWIAQNGLKQSRLISNTTIDQLREIVQAGMLEGFSNAEIISLMQQASDSLSTRRSKTITITETHNAATFASLESTKIMNDEFDLKLKKEWVTAEDERVRSSHRQADGQLVGIDKNFLVNGEYLSRPGDPNGSAGNVINCRCVVVYVE